MNARNVDTCNAGVGRVHWPGSNHSLLLEALHKSNCCQVLLQTLLRLLLTYSWILKNLMVYHKMLQPVTAPLPQRINCHAYDRSSRLINGPCFLEIQSHHLRSDRRSAAEQRCKSMDELENILTYCVCYSTQILGASPIGYLQYYYHSGMYEANSWCCPIQKPNLSLCPFSWQSCFFSFKSENNPLYYASLWCSLLHMW